ncbi:hypothetical protein CHS0354_032969 [Potamilus streckersoni]|uniref:Uncharacterized protein n=1 Tax=Potamilus streckersoni TaxID=2493646 RepID=A0AAE0VK51_9BIVA|nr:hypothetical protein CHS0354_032969 [Potamilus streckersoni]
MNDCNNRIIFDDILPHMIFKTKYRLLATPCRIFKAKHCLLATPCRIFKTKHLLATPRRIFTRAFCDKCCGVIEWPQKILLMIIINVRRRLMSALP